MESNRSKRRGLSKSKLVMSLYRATKPSSASLQPYASSKPPKPTPSNPSLTSPEPGLANRQPVKPNAPPSSTTTGFIIVKQDQVLPQQKTKVGFAIPDHDAYGKLENFHEDHAVDEKAARYISSVQERFRLERINSGRKELEDVLQLHLS